MLKNITVFIKNLGSKFLIIIIALSFALWGIGDIFVSNNNPTIAKVGKSEIKLNEFQLDYQLLIDRLRQTNQQPVTEELLKALGIQNNVIDNLISKKYINILSKNLNINVGDKYVKKAIVNNPIFNDQLGVFNKDYFNYFLTRNNLKEKDIYNISKDTISNDLLLQSIGHSEFVPNIIANNFIKKRDLVRKAKIFTVDTSAKLISDKNFGDNLINEKYQKEKSNFLTPETRDISIVSFNYKKQLSSIDVSEQELENFYNQNFNLYKSDETRNIFVAQFESEKEINEFIAFFQKNKNFFDTLSKFNIKKEDSDLGNVGIDDIDVESSNAIFNLSEKEITKILKTSFGYKVFYLNKINPKKIESFTQAKEQIRKDILKEKANEEIYNLANIFYEKFIQTKSFSSSIENLDVQIKKVNNISLINLGNNEFLNSLGLNDNQKSKLIFDLAANDISEIIEDESNNLHYVYLNNINPAKEKSLSEIKDKILNLLYDEERNASAKKIAVEFKKNFNPDQSIDSLNNNFVKEVSTNWITWDSRLGKNIDVNIKNLIFRTKLNNISEILNLQKGVYIIVLPTEQSNTVLEEEEKSKIENIIIELNNSIETDLNSAIIQDMSKLYKSNVNQKFLNSF
ncbi:MAG: hypothetical protein CMJ08_01870 [Pelagibacterales bacterium]|nr:hypothetical protein [Pelagibacterales bacterium]